MIELWRFNYLFVLLSSSFFCNCWSLNYEGLVLLKFRQRILSDPFGALANWNDGVFVLNPCYWNGVECSDGNVVSLDLRDMCLKGTLGPELANLMRLKSILVDSNQFLDCVSPEICKLQMLSKIRTDEKLISRKRKSCNENSPLRDRDRDVAGRKLLVKLVSHKPKNIQTSYPPSIEQPPVPPPEEPPSQPPSISPSPAPSKGIFPFSTAKSPVAPVNSSKHSNHRSLIIYPVIGGVAVLIILVAVVFLSRCNNLAVVRPWKTGLSEQLQRALISGVPKLRRSELETACEDFSNVIGSSSFSTLYKGTLSTGVEIAVMFLSVSSLKDWTNDLETKFKEKIKTLSKTNHKNFVNLLGYCEEDDEPFTRMMVFEYAPNGTLFEHLHIKEAEHLDWSTRMRIVMGIAYCLEYIHEMTPPTSLENLNSKAIYLTEDYAAKVSDFCMLNDVEDDHMEANPASNVYSFGVMLLEIVTGKVPYSDEYTTLKQWASDCLIGDTLITDMADPILNSFEVQQLERIIEVIRLCVNPDPIRRQGMKEVSVKLREVTSIGPDRAIPRLSPLWWAEILSADGN